MIGDEEAESVTDAKPDAVGERDADKDCESDTVPELQKLAEFEMIDAVDDDEAEAQLVGTKVVDEVMVIVGKTVREIDVEIEIVGELEPEIVDETVNDSVGVVDAVNVIAVVDDSLTVDNTELKIVTVVDVVEE